MARRQFIIIASDNSLWQIGFCDGDTPPVISLADATAAADPSNVAAGVRRALDDAGYRDSATVLAIPSAWCLCATVSLDGLPRKNRRSAMVYRLEEKLPVAAEEFVCDFTISESGRAAMGVACVSARLVPLVEALEGAGIAIQHICPIALLAARQFSTSPTLDGVFILAQGENADALLLERGRPLKWFLLRQYGAADLAEHVRALRGSGSEMPIHAVNVAHEPLAEAARRLGHPHVVRPDVARVSEAVVMASAEILSGRLSPPLELRQDALAIRDGLRQVRRPLMSAIVSVVIALLCVSASMWYRGTRYQRLAADYEEQQRVVFRQALPGQTVPQAARMRLASEERRLRGVSGEETGTDAATSAVTTNALTLLKETFERLPRDVRLRILEARFGDGRIYLDGQARAHGDADTIASMLRKNPALVVEPPRSDQLSEKGIAFSISAAVQSLVAGGEKRAEP